VNDEFGRKRYGQIEVISRNLCVAAEEYNEEYKVAGDPAEVRTGLLLNMSRERNRYAHPLSLFSVWLANIFS
jgi:hypothetical protein